MPALERKNPIDADERLSQLIRLKQSEKPDAAFWDEFDKNYQAKQLSALVRVQPWYERAGRLAWIIVRKAAPATVAAGAVAVGIFVVRDFKPAEAEVAATTEPVDQPIIEPTPLFTMAEIAEAEHPPEFDASPVYQLNVIQTSNFNRGYQLRTQPKILSTDKPQAGLETQLGAKVIQSGNQF